MQRFTISLVFLYMFAVTSVVSANNAEVDPSCRHSLTQLRRTAKSVSNSNLVPMLNIPGTKLYTGIYYKVGMKSFPQGWITWTYTNNYIEVELNPSELPKYENGQPFQFDNQWSFGVTESDLGYTLTNRGKPFGFLIWVHAAAGAGNHVSVYDDTESIKKMSAGGEWRKDVSWIPQSTNEGNYYQLENLANRGSFLTWTYKKHNDFNYYLQLANYDAKEDAKFSFQPSGIKLEAIVYDFEFKENLEDILKKDQGSRTLSVKKHFPNLSDEEIVSTVEELTQTNNSVLITFKESLTLLDKTTLVMDTDGTNVSFDGGFEKNEDKPIRSSKTLSLKKEIKIAAYTDVQASIYVVSANVEMPFTAKINIFGLADRTVVDHPDEVDKGNVPADVIEDFIKSAGGNNLEIISKSGEKLTVRISGVLKGNIALKTVMDTVEEKIFTMLS